MQYSKAVQPTGGYYETDDTVGSGCVMSERTYIVRGSLPPGMTLDVRSGVLRGRPTKAGWYAAKVKSECGTESDSHWLTFEVTPSPYEPWAVLALVVIVLFGLWLSSRRREA